MAGLFGGKKYIHTFFLCRAENTAELRNIIGGHVHAAYIQFYHGIFGRRTFGGVYGVDGFRVEQYHIACGGAEALAARVKLGVSRKHKDYLHEIVPVRADREAVALGVAAEALRRRVQRVSFFKKVVHGFSFISLKNSFLQFFVQIYYIILFLKMLYFI